MWLVALTEKPFCRIPFQRGLVPQWDLGLVLSTLKLPPFEAATEVDLKFVSYKCCFLLALAC
jgi:hypothetical protein